MSILVIAILIIIAAVVAWVMLRRGEILRFETTAAPAEVIHSAVSIVGTKRRWAVLSNNDTAATFGYHKKPSKLIAFVLFFCFIIPSVVYLVLAGKRESLAVSTSARPGSNTAVQIVSNGWRGKGAGRGMQRQLGSVEGSMTADAIEPGEAAAEISSDLDPA